jgi:hypothetical protein
MQGISGKTLTAKGSDILWKDKLNNSLQVENKKILLYAI